MAASVSVRFSGLLGAHDPAFDEFSRAHGREQAEGRGRAERRFCERELGFLEHALLEIGTDAPGISQATFDEAAAQKCAVVDVHRLADKRSVFRRIHPLDPFLGVDATVSVIATFAQAGAA